MLRTIFVFVLLTTIAYCTSLAVSELDVASFQAILSDADTDSLVLFTKKAGAEKMMDTLARRLTDSSTRLYTYDVARNGGFPAGLHLHDGHGDSESDCVLIIFPAGGREASVYNFAHDPLSISGGGSPPTSKHTGHDEDDDEDDEHDHHHHQHATQPSVIGTLRWLKTASSFPATIPSIELSEIWEGREDELFQAVASGAAVIRERMANLKATVVRLEAENAALKKSCITSNSAEL
jgi:hypothetical protein